MVCESTSAIPVRLQNTASRWKRRQAIGLCIFVIGMFHTYAAKAWTEAKVQSVRTDISIVDNTSAEIHMMIGVKVKGGWLSSFEIEGLDSNFILDSKRPPLFISENNRYYRPKIRSYDDGRIQLYFDERRRALRKGFYTLLLKYRTNHFFQHSKRIDKDKIQVAWTLPAWHVGLENVQIHIVAPLGSRFITQPSDPGNVIERSRMNSDSNTTLSWRRVQLPRTVEWRVYFEIPKPQNTSSVPDAQNELSLDTTPMLTSQSPIDSGQWLAGALALLILFKQLLIFILSSSQRLRPIPLIPIKSSAWRIAVIITTAIVSSLLYDEYLSISLILLSFLITLGISRGFRKTPVQHKGYWEQFDPHHNAKARYIGFQNQFHPAYWLDATTFQGMLLLATIYTIVIFQFWQGDTEQAIAWAYGALLCTPVFFTSTRLDFPLTPPTVLKLLAKYLKKIEKDLPTDSQHHLSLLIYKTRPDTWHEARLRLNIDASLKEMGFQLADVVMANPNCFNTCSPQLALLLSTTINSPADRKVISFLYNTYTYTLRSEDQMVRLVQAENVIANITILLDELLLQNPQQRHIDHALCASPEAKQKATPCSVLGSEYK